MNKFEVKDIDKKLVVLCNSSWDEDEGKWCYSFHNTTCDSIKIYASENYTHHLHPLMILLELSYNMSDIWWCNGTAVKDSFDYMRKTMLEEEEYFKPMFRMCTEYIINCELKELNNLLDYTEYWAGES